MEQIELLGPPIDLTEGNEDGDEFDGIYEAIYEEPEKPN